MADVSGAFERAVAEFGERVAAVGASQWALPTPCSEWDVRALVNHLTAEDRWAPPLLEGLTIAQVGDQFEGDVLGADPHAAWADAAAAAVAAAAAPGAPERTVHVSFGDIPGHEYVAQLTCDHVIHAWDLARAVGADDRIDPELVDFVHGYLESRVDSWRAAGVFGPAADPPAGAEPQARLIALTGRRP